MRTLFLLLLVWTLPAIADCRKVFWLSYPHPLEGAIGLVQIARSAARPFDAKDVVSVREEGAGILLVTKSQNYFFLEPEGRGLRLIDEWGKETKISLPTFQKDIEPHLPAATPWWGRDGMTSDYFRHASRMRAKGVEAITESLKFLPKVLFYPYAIPYKVARHWMTEKKFLGMPIHAAIAHTMMRDGIAIAGYLLLVYSGGHPALVFLQTAVDDDNHKGYGISLQDFMDSPARTQPAGDGITIFVDGVPETNQLDGVGRYLFDRRFASSKKAHYLRAKNVAELSAGIARLAKETGKKVDSVVVVGHGIKLEGTHVLNIGDDLVTTNVEKIRANKDALVQSAKARAAASGQPVPADVAEIERGRVTSLTSMPDLRAHFTPGASARLISCSIGSGAGGDQFMEVFGRKTVGNGGKVIASTRDVDVGITDFPPEKRTELLIKYVEEAQKALDTKKEDSGRTWLGAAQDQAYLHAILPYVFVEYSDDYFRAKPRWHYEETIKTLQFPAK